MRFPVPADTKIVWAIASLLFVLVFTVRDRSAAWTFVASDAPAWRALLEAAVLSAFGALCLWQQLRRVFLTGPSQASTFVAVWMLFAIGYPALGALIMLAGEDVRWVGPLHEAADWRLNIQAIAAGQLAFLGAMLASLVWNADEPGFAAVRLNRAVALRMIVEARRHQSLTQFQRAQLVGALAALKDEAPKLSAKLLGASDAALLERWWNGAETLHQMLAPRPTELLAGFDWTAGAASDALGELQANR